MNEEYKQLMIFHILTSDISYPEARYAAVDKNGQLWCYHNKPAVASNLTPTPNASVMVWKNMDTRSGVSGKVCNLGWCEFWTDTLIEL